MSLDIGINFRATSTFVTDGTNETYCIADVYPTTRAGVTFGWPNANPAIARDRVNTNDRRLAGINFVTNNGTQSQFRLDLPASGNYTIHLALGDPSYLSGYQYLKITDGSGGTALLTIDDTNGTSANHFDDATAADLTNTTWPTTEAGVSVTFTGTVLWLVLGSPTAQAGSSTLAHLRVVQASAATIVDEDEGLRYSSSTWW